MKLTYCRVGIRMEKIIRSKTSEWFLRRPLAARISLKLVSASFCLGQIVFSLSERNIFKYCDLQLCLFFVNLFILLAFSF